MTTAGGGESTGSETTEPMTGPTTDAEESSASDSISTTNVPGPVCGDGMVDDGEECDDGNMSDADGCLALCKLAACGDGIVYLGSEECDDGNGVQTDNCLDDCLEASCGDGVVWMGKESCDDGNNVDNDDCTNDCALSSCGDAAVQMGEECDDGNAIDTDACKSSCTYNVCGDGVIEEGIEICDDGNAVLTDGCVACAPAKCGDGHVQADVEECDDKNLVDTDACSNSCKLRCGNGVVDAGEECDDGNKEGNDTCSPACERDALMVFVTSQKWSGNLGGLVGADAKCESAATAAKLPGAGTYSEYVAWVSTQTPTVDAKDRIYPGPDLAETRYILPTGVEVATSHGALVNSNLDLVNSINVKQDKQSLGVAPADCASAANVLVWTATSGTSNLDLRTCIDWESSNKLYEGLAGRADSKDTDNWTEACPLKCDQTARLYCFEVPK